MRGYKQRSIYIVMQMSKILIVRPTPGACVVEKIVVLDDLHRINNVSHTVTPSFVKTLHQFLTVTDLDLITEFDFLPNCARFT